MADGIEHKTLSINGINMHVAEAGKGPTILFLHGFPECWYTWRHQMSFFASRGFRAVALDLRGYADTTGAPVDDPSTFTMPQVVGDLVLLIDTVSAEERKVFVVGHDLGAIVAWNLSLYRPDRVKALVNMSVAFTKRTPSRKPVERLRAVYGELGLLYYQIPVCLQFQEPGKLESEFASIGTKTVLSRILSYREPAPFYLPEGKPFPDTPITLPPWLSEQDLDYYTSKYEATGFTGPLNYYRAFDINWEVTAGWTGAQVNVPVKFLVGDMDMTYSAPEVKDYINKGGMKKDVPLLKEVVVLEGVAHFLHEEKPDEVNAHILDFFKKYSSSSFCSVL